MSFSLRTCSLSVQRISFQTERALRLQLRSSSPSYSCLRRRTKNAMKSATTFPHTKISTPMDIRFCILSYIIPCPRIMGLGFGGKVLSQNPSTSFYFLFSLSFSYYPHINKQKQTKTSKNKQTKNTFTDARSK